MYIFQKVNWKATELLYVILGVFSLLLSSSAIHAQSGSALFFNRNAGQFVSVPHSSSINLGAYFTMEAIVNYSGTNITIIDKGDYDFLWQLNANSNGNKMGFFNKNSSAWIYSTGSAPQGVSTHVAITLDGTLLTFYINGVASGTGIVSFAYDAQPLNIGRQQPTACQCNHFNGVMDEVRIWSLARSQGNIQAYMNTSLPPGSLGLAAYYKFDEASGTTTTDASGNGNTGTLVNGTSWFNGTFYASPGTYSYTIPAGTEYMTVQLWVSYG